MTDNRLVVHGRANLTMDKNGRPWAKLSELKDGDYIEIDGGFTCAKQGVYRLSASVRPNGKIDLYFPCDDIFHFLDGQADDGEHLIGIYNVEK